MNNGTWLSTQAIHGQQPVQQSSVWLRQGNAAQQRDVLKRQAQQLGPSVVPDSSYRT